jgi:hypothetical protein
MMQLKLEIRRKNIHLKRQIVVANLKWTDIEQISVNTRTAETTGSLLPKQTTYSILEGFVRFLYNYDATKTRNKEKKYPFKTADSRQSNF